MEDGDICPECGSEFFVLDGKVFDIFFGRKAPCIDCMDVFAQTREETINGE